MKEERLQDDCATSADSARDLTEAISQLPGGRHGEATLPMRTRNHPKRPVLRAAFVKVNPDGDELREQLIWGLNEGLAFFHGPNAEAGIIRSTLPRLAQGSTA